MRNDHYGGDKEEEGEEHFPLGTNVKIFLATIKVDVLEDSIKNRKTIILGGLALHFFSVQLQLPTPLRLVPMISHLKDIG